MTRSEKCRLHGLMMPMPDAGGYCWYCAEELGGGARPGASAVPVLYECDCCERRNVPAKLKGIGYLCDDCLASWTWDYGRYPADQDPPDHGAGRTCPFRAPGAGACTPAR